MKSAKKWIRPPFTSRWVPVAREFVIASIENSVWEDALNGVGTVHLVSGAVYRELRE